MKISLKKTIRRRRKLSRIIERIRSFAMDEKEVDSLPLPQCEQQTRLFKVAFRLAIDTHLTKHRLEGSR